MLRLLGVSPIVTREAVSILTIKIQRLGTYQHWILEYLIQGMVDHNGTSPENAHNDDDKNDDNEITTDILLYDGNIGPKLLR